MAATVEKKPREHTDETRRQAMAIYAFCSGREDAIVALLEDADLDVPFGTVSSWVNRHKDDYRQIKSEVDGHARTILADSHRRLATMAMENEEEALCQLATLLDKGEITPKELPKMAEKMGILSGIHTEKTELLSDRPTSRVAADLGDIKATLKLSGIEVIEGTASEEPDHPELPAGAGT